MRGRANDPVVARAKARRHATRAHYCSCGKVAFGNGGWSSHVRMHERRGEWRTTYTLLTLAQYQAKFPEPPAT